VNSIFKPFLREFVLIFFDGILLYRKYLEEHVQHVHKVLQILEEQQFYENPSKCVFGVQEGEYLGHIISHEGVKVDPNKIKAMRECPIPKTLKKIKVLLRLAGYYHNFFNNYGQIQALLTTLLKKESFSWIQEATKAFEKLKEAMCTTIVLAIVDFTKKNIMDYDASGHSIHVVLMQ
jgi:hypothetical protein